MATMVSNLELIRRVPLFSVLTDNQAVAVAEAVVKQRFKKGEVLIEQGKKSDALIIILTGRVRVMTTDAKGREVILATLYPGDPMGEMSLIDNEPHSASVQAEMQTDALVLGRTEFTRCMPEEGSMAHAIMRSLVRRLRNADRQIESLALVDVYGRVARALIEFSSLDGHGNAVIARKVSRQDLAKMVGASREMVSRVMKDLEERGLIETREDQSLVLNDRLASLG